MANKTHQKDQDDEDIDEEERDEPEDKKNSGAVDVEDEEASDESKKKDHDADNIEIVEDSKVSTHQKPADDDRSQQRRQESAEEKRLRHRAERERKKSRRLAAEARDKAIIQRQQQELEQLKTQFAEFSTKVPQFEQRQQAQDEAQLDNAIESQRTVYNNALTLISKAMAEGNAEQYAHAMRVKDDANGKYNQLTMLKQNYQTQKQQATTKQTTTQTQQKAPDPRVQANVNRWMVKNEWYDPAGRDEDSKRTKEIDADLAKEGYDPVSKEYFDELDARVREELPHLFEQTRTRTINGHGGKPRPRQVSGSIGADSYSGDTPRLQIPAHVVQNAKDAGMWDDAEKKKLFLKNWKEQNGAGG